MQNRCDTLIESLKNVDTSLGNARIKCAEINEENNLITVQIISDVAISSEGVSFIETSIKNNLPSNYTVLVKCQKSIADATILKRAIYNFITSYYGSISHSVAIEDISIFTSQSKFTYELKVDEYAYDYLNRTAFIQNLNEFLYRNYVNDIVGGLKLVIKEEAPAVYEEYSVNESELQNEEVRRFKVQNVEKTCDDYVYDTAVYIADGTTELGTVFFAGIVETVEERQTKNGKPFFVITLSDKTAKVSGRFFTADKNKIKKIQRIGEGSQIIMRGENELFNEHLNLTIKGFHFCEFPKNFTPKEKPSKPVSDRYSLITPKSVESVEQSDFFSGITTLPSDVLDAVYTVVDIETTGTDAINDKITEIGAVKIINGKILEEFHTLVNPQVPIPERIIELTGIDDNLVKDSPIIDDVYADFFKFISGTTFVAHNSDFDFKFLSVVGKKLGYILTNNVVDTLELSRKKLPFLKRHKLNIVCEHYGITFHHHRALSDAYATAELFLRLKKEGSVTSTG